MITRGPYAPKVTQWVSGTPTTDSHGNEVPAFTTKTVPALAVFPGNSLETDNPAGDVTMSDYVVLLDPSRAVSERDEFTIGNLRYRVNGAPGRYLSPFTGTAVTQVNLRRIT